MRLWSVDVPIQVAFNFTAAKLCCYAFDCFKDAHCRNFGLQYQNAQYLCCYIWVAHNAWKQYVIHHNDGSQSLMLLLVS